MSPQTSGDVVHISLNPEFAVHGWQLGVCHAVHVLLVTADVVLQVFDGDKTNIVLFRHLLEFRRPHHGAVFSHHLTAKAHFFQSGQSHQVHRRFGMSVPNQNTAVTCHQWEHVSRSSQIVRLSLRIRQHPAGIPSLLRGDSGGGIYVVDGYGKSSAMVVGIFRYHLRQVQPVGEIHRHRRADQAFGMGRHEVHVLRGGVLRRTDQVSFILPIRIVGAENQFSGSQRLQRFFHCVVFKTHCNSPPLLFLFALFHGRIARLSLF